jgi:large subunit ribosomal protein L25
MAIHELNAKMRTDSGKGAAHKLRGSGLIPAIAYGFETEPTMISLNDGEFIDFIRHHNASTALFKLKMEPAGPLSSKVFIIREMQLHHIERTPLSVDFMAIDMNKPVEVTVPLVFQGTAMGIKTGGLVTPLIRKVEVSCLPTNIPYTIHCDVTELLEGVTWYVKSLALPQGVSLATPEDTPLVACTTPRQTTPEEDAAAATKAAEEAAAEGAEGAEGKSDKPEKGEKGDKPEKTSGKS